MPVVVSIARQIADFVAPTRAADSCRVRPAFVRRVWIFRAVSTLIPPSSWARSRVALSARYRLYRYAEVFAEENR